MTKRNTSQKRESIVAAALQAFQSDGYENATMDGISALAGASKRTVYNHFESKEALFKAVIARFIGEISAAQAIEFDATTALADQLEAFAETKERILTDPAWLGMMKVGLSVVVSNPELARSTLPSAHAGEDHLAAWLATATSEGLLQVPDPPLAAEMFWAMVSGAIVWPQLTFGPMEADHVARLRSELIGLFLCRYT